MQRFAPRSQFLTDVQTLSVNSRCPGQGSSHGWTPLAAVAFMLVARGLAAAEPDNVLLDFTATWCGPCQQMSSIVSRLERQGLPIRKVDVDHESQLAAKHGVKSIPCFVLIANGKELDRVSGLTTEQQLRAMLNRLPKTDPIAKGPNEPKRGDGPDLGQPIPITPPKGTDPRPALPPDFGSSGGGTIRLQTPEANPLRSSVRIRVKDGSSINYGSGTIIDSQPGKAIVMSCGHIFRKLSKNAVIEVDVYANPKSAKPDMIPGTVLLTDLDADVSLISISYPQRLPCIRLSSLPLSSKDRLFSIGCSGGDNPSREDVELIAINKYDGPDNLECSGRPQKGRSGGGLFRDDELVGICIAADPKEPRGIYAGLQPVSALLEKAGLERLAPRIPQSAPPKSPSNVLAEVPPTGKSATPPAGIERRVATTDDDIERLLERELNVDLDGASQEFAGAEIICIVRSRTPGTPSRVVIVNRASERFVADLLHESGSGRARPSGEPDLAERKFKSLPERGPVETSFETQPYRRTRDK